VFGPKRDEVTGEWRKLLNEELNVLLTQYCAGGKIEKNEMVGKPEGKRPLGRPKHRWEDNIKMDLQEVGGCGGDWMERAQDRDRWRTLVSRVMNFRVP
jgi:hypothetical protein